MVEVVFRVRRIVVAFALVKVYHFAFVFFQQADVVVFGVSLEKHDTKAVRADRQMHAGFPAGPTPVIRAVPYRSEIFRYTGNAAHQNGY